MARKKIPNSSFHDGYLHEVLKNDRGEFDEDGTINTIFPVTRYANILNRPKVESNIRASGNPEFMLVPVEEEEVPDGTIYRLFQQEW